MFKNLSNIDQVNLFSLFDIHFQVQLSGAGSFEVAGSEEIAFFDLVLTTIQEQQL